MVSTSQKIDFHIEPNNLTDSNNYSHVYDKTDIRQALPPWCYTSQRFFKHETNAIFTSTWILLDRIDRIPNNGDYFCTSYLKTGIIAVRGNDGNVRAFSNSCRHRGTRVASGEGSARAFVCPYHSWSYTLEGDLKTAPGFNDAEGNPLISPANTHEYGLREFPTATWGGFLFIRFSDDGSGLDAQLGDLPQRTSGYQFENMICTRRSEYQIAANWKLIVDNYNEPYHVATVHRGTLNRQKRRANPPEETNGDYLINWHDHEGSRLLLSGDDGFPAIPTLEGRYQTGTIFTHLFPNAMVTASIDGMLFYICEPVGPDQTKLVVGSCFPNQTVARNDFANIAESYYRRVDKVTAEDVNVLELQQIGLSSPFARPPRLCSSEVKISTINKWVLDRVLEK